MFISVHPTTLPEEFSLATTLLFRLLSYLRSRVQISLNMGTGIGCEHKNLMNIELKQGQELANQLREQLCSPKRSKETCEILVATILSSFEKSLSILKSSALKLQDDSMLNCLHSSTGDDSPRSEMPDEPHKNVFKKRKAMTQWSEQVQVPFGPGVEGPVGDEYCWRKYGQKNILGATFPRAYYRCTYRNSQGCLATKQVQRSDESLSLQVIYKGRHTCKKGSELSAESASCGNQEKRHKIQKQNVEKTINFGTSDRTEELGRSIEFERIPSFSFPSTNHICAEDTRKNSFIDSRYFPSLVNQETSECSYLSLSPYHNMNNFEIGQNLRSSVSSLAEILSTPNSVTNSPICNFDLLIDPVDFDPDFPLDILEFFS